MNKLFVLQKRCIRLITFSRFDEHSEILFKSLELLKIGDILKNEVIKFFYSYYNGTMPSSILPHFSITSSIHDHITCNFRVFHIPSINTIRFGKNSLRFACATIWNSFFKNLDNIENLSSWYKLKTLLRKKALESYLN